MKSKSEQMIECPECEGRGLHPFTSLQDEDVEPCPTCGWMGRIPAPASTPEVLALAPAAACVSFSRSYVMNTLRFVLMTVFLLAKGAHWLVDLPERRRARRIIAARLAEICAQ